MTVTHRDITADAVAAKIVGYQGRIIGFEGRRQLTERGNGGAHIGVFPLAFEEILAIGVFQIAVDPPFAPGISADQEKEGDSDGQTDNIKQGVEPAPGDVPDSSSIVVADKHGEEVGYACTRKMMPVLQ
jgi:hypothetical protein